MTWQVLHADLSASPERIESSGPAYVVFWWGALPLGARACAAEEFPLDRGYLVPLAARLIAEQLAGRGTECGGVPWAGSDAQPRPADVAAKLAACGDEPLEHIQQLAEPADVPADDLAVVVCTRDRPKSLARCLRALAAQRSSAGEIIVVDNSPHASAAAICAAFPGVRHVHEPRGALSRARNAGIAASTRPLIAFTDDDVEAAPGWTAELVHTFALAPAAAALTGLVLPGALRTAAQRCFQFELGAFGNRFTPLQFDARFLQDAARLGPQVWRIGAGANMAFRRAVLDAVGGFDERLGAGAAGCSEDSELWYRILAAGGCCFYEPRLVVHHHHRADWPALERQVQAYMRGHVAALLIQYQRYRHRGNLRRIVLQLPRHFARTGWTALQAGSLRRMKLLAREVRGWFAGLTFLVRAKLPKSRGAHAQPQHKAPLGSFLAGNPFPHPLTEGLFYREKMRAIHAIAPERLTDAARAPRVLEIGGGRSGLGSLLYPAARVTTLDRDRALLEQAPDAETATAVCADACVLPFAPGSFDAVTLFDVLEHITDDRRAVSEALRITRPGGWILVSTPDVAWRYPYYRILRRWCPPESQLLETWGHVRRGYTPESLTGLFGLEPVRRATFVNALTAFFHDIGFSHIGRRGRRVLYVLAAPVALLGYLLHRPHTRGTETALAWQRE